LSLLRRWVTALAECLFLGSKDEGLKAALFWTTVSVGYHSLEAKDEVVAFFLAPTCTDASLS
jgi:hypothetical protein